MLTEEAIVGLLFVSCLYSQNLLQNQDLRPDTLSSLLSPALPAQVHDLCVEVCVVYFCSFSMFT